MKRYDTFTPEGCLAFVKDFGQYSKHLNKEIEKKKTFEYNARMKRDLGYEDEEIWRRA